MKRYIFSLLLVSCFVVSSILPVSADWEFTKWEMSPEQVVQASKGQAHRPPSSDKIPSVLIQDWQSGRFLFAVSYLFEGAGGQRLTRVQLQLKNPELKGELLAALKNKYGTPLGEITGPVSGPYWEYSGDNINYLTDQETVTIVYAPIKGR